MGRHRARKPLFTIGDFVFAKVRGYRAWPARILDRAGLTAYNVYFYGTCNHAKVPRSQIVDFQRNQRRLGVFRSKGYACHPDFRGAMLHARQAFANPEMDYGYYQQMAVNEGHCVNAEDLKMEYAVVDVPDSQQKLEEKQENQGEQDAREEGWMNLLMEDDSSNETPKDPLVECGSHELDSMNQPKKQVSVELDSKDPLEEQDVEQYYLMAQFTPLKSDKIYPMDKQKDRDAEVTTAKDLGLVFEGLESKDRSGKQVGEGNEDQLVEPEPVKQNSMPQLDGLDSDEIDFKEQEKVSKALLDKDVQELMDMLEDYDEHARIEEDYESEMQKLEGMYFMDQPLNLTCRRRC
ncbi:hepatoma-derived growth factor [Drosophila biarmipes]|uniref:hepatoma-derived growth factor n=1 Tax=Drosophila biarmipes TaxID=125945 RepID=UPI0007E7EA97|nr:hepatoma-derived growth factor [Drosophila biarmipes]